MSEIQLHFPVFVQQILIEEKPHFQVRPLFYNFPFATNRRYETALSHLLREIRKMLKGTELNRDNLEQLLWFMFDPEIQYFQIPLDIKIGKQYTKGTFGLGVFEVKNLCFGILPAFDNYIFLFPEKPAKAIETARYVENIIPRLFRQIQNEFEETLELSSFFSAPEEFIVRKEISVNVHQATFQFEQTKTPLFFAGFMEEQAFDGASEIEKTAYDLNSLYPFGLRQAFHQDELVERLYNLIYQKENTPVILIGPDGVGKHTIIHEVVRRYKKDREEKKKESEQRIWHLDPNRVIAGMSIVGYWQKRFESILSFIIKPDEEKEISDILLIDNVISLVRIGKSSQNNLTLSDVLKPYLEKRKLQMVAIATSEEWKVLQEKDRRFSDLFQVIRLSEPDLIKSIQIVLLQRRALELETGSQISIQAIKQLFTLHRNFFKNRALPGSVMRLLQQITVKNKFQAIDAVEVSEAFQNYSGFREIMFDETQPLDPEEVKIELEDALVGQSQAVRVLSDVIQLIKSRLNTPGKPFGSFMFIGPTGVGKTQAAKVLCRFLTGREDKLLRFDMNEYVDAYSIQRLIGDYYHPEGQLTGSVRYNPFSIILLDEIEKAHPKIHDLLLQVLDDGRLTDSLGRTVDFSNTILIMTSNIGSKEVASQVGYDVLNKGSDTIYHKSIENFFRPEFINRIDQIVVFKPLTLDHILGIARLQIKELLSRDGFVRRTTILNIETEALEWVARRGYDANMGGRALKRQIENDLTTLSAEQLIATGVDQPVILDIRLREEHLYPEITRLDFCLPIRSEWLPEVPEERQGKTFCYKLLEKVEFFEKSLKNQENLTIRFGKFGPEGSYDLSYYDLKEKVEKVKQSIQEIILRYEDRVQVEYKLLFRLKRNQNLMTSMEPSKLFKKEKWLEINENYRYASSEFDGRGTALVNAWIDTSLLNVFFSAYQKGKKDNIRIQIRSCITSMGEAECDILWNQYIDLLSSLDISHQGDAQNLEIEAEGYGIFQLFSPENGIHLFYRASQNAIPISVIVTKVGQELAIPLNNRILRIYDVNNTITDLRSGFSNIFNQHPAEMKVMVFAGLQQNETVSELP